ncbi:lipoprotein [Lysobacter enzymogenes]|uniref:Lipoprotein n=1 Tax=Lysobacter enzymogenes TaxID=69 RepID=A0A0S2DBF1_LYSEN|nr:AHH domain-containing protein [Lysobacter enzymogenes]ALN55834.1 lipoprotein [Lysobacter enzymogenes]QCW24815.1 hypothetical protein FE772_03130 [Lysobacter enzymogenes]
MRLIPPPRKTAAALAALALSMACATASAQVNCADWPATGDPSPLNLLEAERAALDREAASPHPRAHVGPLGDSEQNAGLQSYPNLMTNGDRRRSLLGLSVNDKMQAHHVFPMAQVRALPDAYKTPLNQVWSSDSAANLIALPSDAATQSAMATPLPIHRGSHIKYSAEIEARYMKKKNDGQDCKLDLTQADNIKKLVDSVISEMRPEIEKGTASKWYPNLCDAQGGFCDLSQDSDGD